LAKKKYAALLRLRGVLGKSRRYKRAKRKKKQTLSTLMDEIYALGETELTSDEFIRRKIRKKYGGMPVALASKKREVSFSLRKRGKGAKPKREWVVGGKENVHFDQFDKRFRPLEVMRRKLGVGYNIHNHPSGIALPSTADVYLARNYKEKIMDIVDPRKRVVNRFICRDGNWPTSQKYYEVLARIKGKVPRELEENVIMKVIPFSKHPIMKNVSKEAAKEYDHWITYKEKQLDRVIRKIRQRKWSKGRK